MAPRWSLESSVGGIELSLDEDDVDDTTHHDEDDIVDDDDDVDDDNDVDVDTNSLSSRSMSQDEEIRDDAHFDNDDDDGIEESQGANEEEEEEEEDEDFSLHSSATSFGGKDVGSSSPPQLPMLQKKKTVSFCELATVMLHEHIYDYTSQEVHDTWYTHDELRVFRRDCLETADRIMTMNQSSCEQQEEQDDMDMDSSSSSSSFCARGCEYRTTMGTMLRQKHRNDAMRAVMDYQRECRLECFATMKHHRDGDHREKNHEDDDAPRPPVTDPDQLAKIYSFWTHHSQQVAQIMGNIDRSAVAKMGPLEDEGTSSLSHKSEDDDDVTSPTSMVSSSSSSICSTWSTSSSPPPSSPCSPTTATTRNSSSSKKSKTSPSTSSTTTTTTTMTTSTTTVTVSRQERHRRYKHKATQRSSLSWRFSGYSSGGLPSPPAFAIRKPPSSFNRRTSSGSSGDEDGDSSNGGSSAAKAAARRQRCRTTTMVASSISPTNSHRPSAMA